MATREFERTVTILDGRSYVILEGEGSRLQFVAHAYRQIAPDYDLVDIPEGTVLRLRDNDAYEGRAVDALIDDKWRMLETDMLMTVRPGQAPWQAAEDLDIPEESLLP